MLLFLWILTAAVGGIHGGDRVNKTVLDDIFVNVKQEFYDNQDLLPVPYTDTTMAVTIDLNLASVNNFDEIGGFLEISGYFHVTWTDTVTKRERYDVTILFERNTLWKPSLLLVNSIQSTSEIGDATSKLRCNIKRWQCDWKPWVVLRGGCSPDTRFYPFDKQICSFKIAGWGHTAAEMTLKPSRSAWNLDLYEENAEWTIESTSSDAYSRNNASYVDFSIELKRIPTYYLINLIAPVTLLSLLNVCVFILPPESGERVGFSITCFLAFVVLLNIVMSFIPSSSANLAYLCYYTFIMMVFSCGMSLATVVTLWIHHKPDTSTIPVVLRGFTYILKCRCFDYTPPPPRRRRKKISSVMPVNTVISDWDRDETQSTDDTQVYTDKNRKEGKEDKFKVTWKDVASLMDFFCLVGFLAGQIFYSVGYLLPIIFNE